MGKIAELVLELGLDLDKQMYNLTQKQLVQILNELASSVNKKELIEIILDKFGIDNLFKVLEKKNKKLLLKLLNEPDHEKDLRRVIGEWFKERGFAYDFEVPLPGKRKRLIDVVGYKKGGWLSSEKLVAVEIKTTPSRSAIDSAFSQAKDYLDAVDEAYVAVSPYVWLKYADVLKEKREKYEYTIGIIVADKAKVIRVFEAEESKYDKKKYNELKSRFT